MSGTTDICAEVRIYQYGIVQCKTKPIALTKTSLTIKVAGVIYACIGVDDECSY